MGKKVDSIHTFGEWEDITGGSKHVCVECGECEYKAANGLNPVVVNHRNLDGSLIEQTIVGVGYGNRFQFVFRKHDNACFKTIRRKGYVWI